MKERNFPASTKQQAKAVLYLRVSTGPQAEGTSLTSQLVACRQKAAQMGAEVVGVYEDVQSGADYRDREGLQAALGRIERGEANTLIIYDMTRYSRDQEHQQLIKKRVLAARAKLEFATFDVGDLNSAEAHLSFGVRGVFAEYERLNTRDRTMRGRRTRALNGIQTHRSLRPFGYDLVTNADVMQRRYEIDQIGKYIIREDEAKWVREIFRRYADGESLEDIRKLLTANVPPHQGGKEWWPESIRRILGRRMYKGDGRYGMTEAVMDESRLERGLRKTYSRPVPLEEQIPLDVPAIVDEDLWDRCQVQLKTNKDRYSGFTQNRWLLSSLLRCPLCHGKMQPRKSKWWGSREQNKRIYRGTIVPTLEDEQGEIMTFWQFRRLSHVYSCRNARLLDPERRCPGYKCPVYWADEQVLGEVVALASDPTRLADYLLQRANQNARKNSKDLLRREELQQQLLLLQGRERNVLALQERAIANDLDPGLYDGMLRSVASERRFVQEQLEQFQSRTRISSGEDARKKSREIGAILQKTRDVLLAPDERIPPFEKNLLLHQVIDRIEIEPQEDKNKPSFKIIWRED